jgi:hypothetical protein
MTKMSEGIVAVANSPLRAVLTSVIGGLTLALLVWVASLLSYLAHTMPVVERRIAAIEARDDTAREQATATREALAVLRTQMAGMQEEMRLLRATLLQQQQREPAR